MNNRYKKSDLFFAITIAVILIVPCLLFLNTLRNYKPEANSEKTETYQAKLSSYEGLLTDSLFYKKELISYYYLFKTKLLKESCITSTVIQGTNDWLFYSGNGDGYGIDSYTGDLKLADTLLLKIKNNLEEQQNWLKKKNIDFYLIICPNKQTVYSEYFPYKKGITVADQIIPYLKKNTKLKIIDLRQPMIRAKDGKHLLYYKTDSHWTYYGGFVGYTEIFNQISSYNPSLRPYPITDFKVDLQEVEGKDIAAMVNLNNHFKDYNYEFELIDSSETQKRNVVLFHDSYFKFLRPFFGNHFNVTERPHQWNSFDYKVIEDVKPEIVFYEVVERYLTAYSRENPKEIKDTLNK